MIKLRTAIGELKLDVYSVVHYFKQERGVSTALLAIQNGYSIGFLKSFIFQLGRISLFEKI